jgi:hypothetical protein
MDAVIGSAVADVNRLAAATGSLAGQLALVNALTVRLEQTWQTLINGNAHASTHAASSAQVAAAYGGVGGYPVGGLAATVPMSYTGATSPMGTMSPMGAMSPMGELPMLTAASMAANQAALSGAQAASMQQSTSNNVGERATLTSSITDRGSPAAAIPVSAVRYERRSFASGRANYVGYINQTLDVMGIRDHAARNNWMNFLMHKARSESSWNPLAINDWDSNAHGPRVADGYPFGCSRGGLQTIPTTFAAHHEPGTSTNIYNPVANAAAAMNYVMSRYGVHRNGSNLGAVPQGGY